MSSVSPSAPPPQASGTAAPSPTAASGTVAPATATTGSLPASPAATQPQLASILTAPDALASLNAGTTLTGTVATSDAAGALLKILTNYGPIELNARLALPAGTKITLHIRENGQVQIQVLPPETAGGQAQGANKALPDAAVRLPNQVLTATLESTAASALSGNRNAVPAGAGLVQGPQPGAGAALPPALQQLSAGAQFQVQLTAINTATAGTSPAPPSAPGLAPPTAAAGGTPATGPARASTAQTSPAGPATTPSSPAGNGANPVVSGTVVASAAQGKPVIQTGFGILSLDSRVQLPLGTNLRIQVLASSLPQASPAAAASLVSPAAQSLPNIASTWGNLDALVRQGETSGVSNALASSVLQRVPSAGPGLASNMLFLLSALNSGQINGWLGRPALDLMQREGQADLSARLDQDLAQAGRISEGGGEWRSLILPFLDEGQIRQLRLFIRRDGEESEDDGADQSGADATRFLLEIELSKLGDMQLDGLIRSKLFDLILRTRRPFSRAMRDEIIRIFSESNHSLGLSGQILFEASDEWRPKATELGGLQASPDLMI